jgi:hypothetical protein
MHIIYWGNNTVYSIESQLDILEDHVASILWFKECATQETKSAMPSTCFHAGFLFSVFLDAKNGSDVPRKCYVNFQWTTWHYIP